MSAISKPDGWLLRTGVWGTHAQRDDILSLSGPSSIKFRPTDGGADAIAPVLVSDPFPVRGFEPGTNNDVAYSIWVIARTTSVLPATDQLIIQIDSLASDKVTVLATDPLVAGVAYIPFAAANTWEYHGRVTSFNQNVRFAQIRITTTATNFTPNIDSVFVQKTPANFVAHRSSNYTLAVNTWTTVPLNVVDTSEFQYDTTTGVGTVLAAGMYQLNGAATWSPTNLNWGLSCAVYINRLLTNPRVWYGSMANSSLNNSTLGASVAALDRLAPGDTVEFRALITKVGGGPATAALLGDTDEDRLTYCSVSKIPDIGA